MEGYTKENPLETSKKQLIVLIIKKLKINLLKLAY